MKIHGMCLIKNEADVIAECLRAAVAWCDHIYVWDNGSTDGTWEIVKQLANEHSQIVPWKQAATDTFNDGLRREIYEAFKNRARPEDWWVRLDADEFYVQDPRVFLSAVPPTYDVVWYASLSYYFSSAAAAEYELHPGAFADEVPVAQRCRYYHNHWSEPRFVRNAAMSNPWTGASGWPSGLNRCCPIRIVCKHYAYRSPKQIERRIETRAKAALSGTVFNHEAIKDWSKVVDPNAAAQHKWQDVAYCTDAELLERGWRSRIIPAESLQYDAHDGRYVLNHHLMPPIGHRRTLRETALSFGHRVIRFARTRLVSSRSAQETK